MKQELNKLSVRSWAVGVASIAVVFGAWGVMPYRPEPVTGNVVDGDTLELNDGRRIRLLGINTKEEGEKNFEEAKNYLQEMIGEKLLWIESDRYLVDRYERQMYWVWVDCEKKPTFWGFNYMALNLRNHRPGLMENPEGCSKGKMVSEEMIKAGLSNPYFLKKKGEMKYERRLLGI